MNNLQTNNHLHVLHENKIIIMHHDNRKISRNINYERFLTHKTLMETYYVVINNEHEVETR
jgi:hypothetical protein